MDHSGSHVPRKRSARTQVPPTAGRTQLTAAAWRHLTAQQWREDLDQLVDLLVRHHPDPFFATSEGALQRVYRNLWEQAPASTPEAMLVGVVALVAQLRDGHTRVVGIDAPPGAADGVASTLTAMPLTLRWYADGVCVQKSGAGLAHLRGGRLVRIGDVPAFEIFDVVAGLVSWDNEWRIRAIAPRLMTRPDLLLGLGLVDTVNDMVCEFEVAGSRHTVPIGAVRTSEIDVWSGLASQDPQSTLERWSDNLSRFSLDAASRCVVLKYDRVRDDPGGTLAQRFADAFAEIDAHRAAAVVVDLRQNGGGDNRLNWPLIDGLRERPNINRADRLFVLIGRDTFSAAMQCAMWLERYTRCTFVGEPTGTRPNFFGDAIEHRLNHSGLPIGISSLWWQESTSNDPRTALMPRHRVEYLGADEQQGVDAALRWVATHLASNGA